MKYTSLAPVLYQKFQTLRTNGWTTRSTIRSHFKNIQFSGLWLGLYSLLIISDNAFKFISKGQVFVPFSVSSFINSSWGGSIVFALFLTLFSRLVLFRDLTLDDIVVINQDQVLIRSSDIILTVFCCLPPILHDKNDISFFLENFQPFTIELHPQDQKLYILLFSKQLDDISTRQKECFNLLNSFFSSVSILSSNSLRRFLLNGCSWYSSFAQSFQNAPIVSDTPDSSPFNLITTYSSLKHVLDSLTGVDRVGSQMIFSLMVLGQSNSNHFESTGSGNLFRGLRIGLTDSTEVPPDKRGTNSKPSSLQSFLQHSLRLPASTSPALSLADFLKFYFFIVHKTFNFTFQILDTGSTEVSTTDSSSESSSDTTVSGTITSLSQQLDSDIRTGTSPISDLQSLVQSTSTRQSTKNSIDHNSKLSTDISQPSGKNLVNLEKVPFQFTHFCQFFCSNITKEFRKKSVSIKNAFSIPDNCFDHVSLSNTNLVEFTTDQKCKSTNEVFTNEHVLDKFVDFIREKDLPAVDKICHFSSLLILSHNKSDLEENIVLDVIQSLGDSYFST